MLECPSFHIAKDQMFTADEIRGKRNGCILVALASSRTCVTLQKPSNKQKNTFAKTCFTVDTCEMCRKYF